MAGEPFSGKLSIHLIAAGPQETTTYAELCEVSKKKCQVDGYAAEQFQDLEVETGRVLASLGPSAAGQRVSGLVQNPAKFSPEGHPCVLSNTPIRQIWRICRLTLGSRHVGRAYFVPGGFHRAGLPSSDSCSVCCFPGSLTHEFAAESKSRRSSGGSRRRLRSCRGAASLI